jgi:DNA-binding MarR family transcriptional regulator
MSHETAMRRLAFESALVAAHFNDLTKFWATNLDINGAQWSIMQALMELDRGDGVPVKEVAKLMIVDSSYVTKQWRPLEQNGLVRMLSCHDARFVKLGLTEKARKTLDELALRQEQVVAFIFAEFTSHEVTELVSRLSVLASRLEMALLKVTVEPWTSLFSDGPRTMARNRYEESPLSWLRSFQIRPTDNAGSCK